MKREENFSFLVGGRNLLALLLILENLVRVGANDGIVRVVAIHGGVTALLGDVVVVTLGESVLLVINVLEQEPEDDGKDTTSNGTATEIPGEIGVSDDGGAGKTDKVGNGGGEEVDGGNETTHVGRSTRVSNTVGRDVDEQLRDTTDGVGDSDPPDGDGSDKGNTVGINASLAGTELAARAELVGVGVEDGVADTTKSGEGKTGGHTGNGTVTDVPSAEKGVETVVEDGSHEDDGERVEVADNVVGDTVGGEHGGQVRSSGTDTVVVEVLDREETEDTSSLESTADILNELVIPGGVVTGASSSDHGWLCRLPEAMATDSLETASAETDGKNLENVGKIRTAWRVENETLAEVPEEERERNVEDERNEEGQPPTNVLLAVSGCNTHEASDVNQEVEPEHSTLGRGLRVDNDSLTLLGANDNGDSLGHLIEKERRNVRLEDT